MWNVLHDVPQANRNGAGHEKAADEDELIFLEAIFDGVVDQHRQTDEHEQYVQ